VVGGQYLWGGKGWNWQAPKAYASPHQVLSDGYYYYQAATKSIVLGKGLDCSGLIYWAYNKASGARRYPGSPVSAEGAQDQHDHNTTPVSLAQLRPGDLLFFSDSGKPTAITHVALYVGGSDSTQDIVEATNENAGIVYSSLATRMNDAHFISFGRVRLNRPPILVQTYSPVTTLVTDPVATEPINSERRP
jgi:cell wall-associated NlpC family hydrolase